MKNIILLSLVFICLFIPFLSSAQEKVEVNFFYSATCLHCIKENAFLDDLEKQYSTLEINRFEIVSSADNQELLKTFYDKYDVAKNLRGLIPVTFTPEKYFVGFNDDIASEIESCLGVCARSGKEEVSLSETSIIKKNIKIPFLGEVKIDNLSFPVMAMVLGALDGFNICSLGALILILSLVLILGSKKKIFIFGGLFILTTALVYGFLIVFWYKLFEIVVSYLKVFEILIGILGIGGGLYFFKQFLDLRKKDPTCDSGLGSKIASKFSMRLQNILKQNSISSFFAVALLIFAFAFIITLVEFPCSAVVPVAFAAVLAGAGMSGFQYILYISIFVVFYLLDELIVFLIAIFTSKIRFISERFVKWAILLEAIVLFLLGLYYLLGFLG
ncbi:MAG: hypothetical protein ABH831_00580 [Candidatus Nealsonbacteria bacterium]